MIYSLQLKAPCSSTPPEKLHYVLISIPFDTFLLHMYVHSILSLNIWTKILEGLHPAPAGS